MRCCGAVRAGLALALVGCGTQPPPGVARQAVAVESAAWVQPMPSTRPTARANAAMAFDSMRGRVVLFGGYVGGPLPITNDTWEWDGTTWFQMTPAWKPGARAYSAMAYDPIRHQTVLFGGQQYSNDLVDTWTWDGTNWTQVATIGPSPSQRDSHAMAFDAAHGVIVLHGGQYTGLLGDTWTWDGTSWTNASLAGPPVRQHAMAFDSVTGKTVLFGGCTAATCPTAQTWTWDGNGWTLAAANNPPVAREQHTLVFDPHLGRTLLFGGFLAAGGYFNDVWAFDGTSSTWTMLPAASSPSTRYGHAMAYDSARARTVVFGGWNGGVPLDDDTWELHTRGSACDPAKAGADCDTGKCVDGACCEASACGMCQACNLDAAAGTCATVMNAPDDTCSGAMACDASGNCVTRFANGQACAGNGICQSGFCADGFCCDGACTGTCRSCAITPGTCSAVKLADDPDTCTGMQSCSPTGTCAAKSGATCTGAADCATGFCVDGFCCDTACSGGCDACNVSPKWGTCTLFQLHDTSQNPSCNGFLCDGVQGACPTSCTRDSDCESLYYCAHDGTCKPVKPEGAPCDPIADCKQPSCAVCTSVCTDGFCCDQACSQGCGVCAKAHGATADGVCTVAAKGYITTGSPCGIYTCDGVNPYCTTTCVGDLGCIAGYYCASDGTCKPQKAVAAACNDGGGQDCLLAGCRVCVGTCISNYCCGAACGGGCQRCDLPPGTCSTAAAGYASPKCGAYLCDGSGTGCLTSCSGDGDCAASNKCIGGTCQIPSLQQLGQSCGSSSQCVSGHCVDGVCCDTDCLGPCATCAGTGGHCTAAAVGTDPRGKCAGEAGCAPGCNAQGACDFPDSSKRCDVCRACNGAGKCNQLPVNDDPACMTIACGGLSTECKRFHDLTAMRCVGLGLCATPNDPATCTDFDPLDGVPCAGGVCRAGECVSVPDASTGGGGGASGCQLAGHGAPVTPFVLLLLLVLLTRLRRGW
jgi:hypothetical protein